MVYCGKASQGCQSCRTRRIKCDKVKPDCSQCVRVGKKCPGYRDQLSLMFRDESSKVMQKAHAQWGVGEGPDAVSQASASGTNEPSSSSKSPMSPSGSSQASQAETLPSPTPSNAGTTITKPTSSQASRMSSAVVPTLEQQGFQFYVNRYLLGHPDEPKNTNELKNNQWLFHPALKEISAALGLAGLSNLRGDKELMADARRRYGNGLRTAGELISKNDSPSVDLTSRLVVMLAMFEIVKGTQLHTGSVYAHVAGGAALIRSWYPMRMTSDGGWRPLLQLCYSTFLTAYEVGIPLPAMFNDWVSFSQKVMTQEDQPAAVLGLLIARFIEISSFVRFNVLSDGKTATATTLRQLIDIDVEFADWEESLEGNWCYTTESAPHLPAPAVFQGEYHNYYDMWVARIWNHYRWSRVLVNQLILGLVDQNPVSSEAMVSSENRQERLRIITRLTRDTLVSTPSHWRHPLLGDKTHLPVQKEGGAGAGAAGVPVVLFHLQVAACAPGVPREHWNWAYGVLECIWGDMGMQHAKATMDALLAHREQVDGAKHSPPTPPSVGKPVAAKAPKPKKYMSGRKTGASREKTRR